MLNQIGQIYIPNNNYSSPFTQGRLIKCYWDDVALSIRVYVTESNGSVVTEVFTGPNITDTNGRGRLYNVIDYNYKFCDSGALNDFSMNNQGSTTQIFYVFPYCNQDVIQNHWSCSLVVCDIEFRLEATVITEDSGASDGSITVIATSSAVGVRYTLNQDDTYETANVPTDNFYTFSGLAAGAYTVYAIDENQCRVSLFCIVPEEEAVYGVKVRHEYTDIYGTGTHILDIEERDYTGEITEVCGDGNSVIINTGAAGDRDFFETIKPSDIVISLISETDFQYLELYTQDERKFRIKYYFDGNLKSTYFQIPALYSEPFYTTKNYIVSITGSDGLQDLKEKDFVDDFGNILGSRISKLDVILIILRKTGILLNVWENVNIFEARMGSLFLNFANDSFASMMFPWVNIDSGETGYNFSWSAGNLVSAPGSGSYSGTPAISQTRPDIVADWPVGDYTFSLTANQTGAASGLIATVYGFDDNIGTNPVVFGEIITLADGDPSDTYEAPINVSVAKKYLGVGFVRVGADGLHSVTVSDFSIIQSPAFSSNSSLKQAYIDPTVYVVDGTPKKCDYVLDHILASFGARIYQSDNYWRIELLEQKSASSPYRVFDINGNLVSSGDTYQIRRITNPGIDEQFFINRSALLSIMPSFGEIGFNIGLFGDDNLLDSGDFEEKDLTENGINGWSFDFTNGSGVDVGFVGVDRPDSKGALLIDFRNSGEAGKEVILKAQEFDLYEVAGPSLLFSFDLFVRPTFEEFFSYVDISIKIGDEFVQPNQLPSVVTSNLLDGEYIRIYIDDILKWNTFEKLIESASVRFLIENTKLQGPVIIKIRIDNNPVYHYGSLTALKAAQSTGYTESSNRRVRVLDGANVRFYNLQYKSSASESSPDLILPDDYTTNVWILEKTLTEPDVDFITEVVLIDNVKLSFTNKTRPVTSIRSSQINAIRDVNIEAVTIPETVTYSKTIDDNIQVSLTRDLIHSDFLIDSDGAEDVDASNTNLLRLTRNYITLNDGTPTENWGRSYVADETFIPTVEAFADGENAGTGTDWSVGANPAVTLTSPGAQAKYYLLELTNCFANQYYQFLVNFNINHPGGQSVTMRLFLLDAFLNVLADYGAGYYGTGDVTYNQPLQSTTDDPVYIGIKVYTTTGTSNVTFTLNSIEIDGEQITGAESRSLLEILMLMYRGQLSTPSYRFSGQIIAKQELSFFSTFLIDYVSKLAIPAYLSHNTKRCQFDFELMELKTGDNGLPPATIYEYTEEFTTEFNA